MEQKLVQHPCLGRAPGIGTGGQPRHGCCTSFCSISMWPSQIALGRLAGCGVDPVLPLLPDKTLCCPKCKRLASQIQSCCGTGSLPVYSNHCYPPGLCLLIDKPVVGPIKVLSLGCTWESQRELFPTCASSPCRAIKSEPLGRGWGLGYQLLS